MSIKAPPGGPARPKGQFKVAIFDQSGPESLATLFPTFRARKLLALGLEKSILRL